MPLDSSRHSFITTDYHCSFFVTIAATSIARHFPSVWPSSYSRLRRRPSQTWTGVVDTPRFRHVLSEFDATPVVVILFLSYSYAASPALTALRSAFFHCLLTRPLCWQARFFTESYLRRCWRLKMPDFAIMRACRECAKIIVRLMPAEQPFRHLRLRSCRQSPRRCFPLARVAARLSPAIARRGVETCPPPCRCCFGGETMLPSIRVRHVAADASRHAKSRCSAASMLPHRDAFPDARVYKGPRHEMLPWWATVKCRVLSVPRCFMPQYGDAITFTHIMPPDAQPGRAPLMSAEFCRCCRRCRRRATRLPRQRRPRWCRLIRVDNAQCPTARGTGCAIRRQRHFRQLGEDNAARSRRRAKYVLRARPPRACRDALCASRSMPRMSSPPPFEPVHAADVRLRHAWRYRQVRRLPPTPRSVFSRPAL